MIREKVLILEMIVTGDKPYRGNARQRDDVSKVKAGLGSTERIL